VDFVSGWWIARLLRATPGQQLAMMFGVGLNNNSTALVLGALVFFNQPKILVPLIFYGLIQHLVAGGSTQVLALFSRLSARNAVLGLSRA
jgi:BASS family bile acid:Na+ symporter